MKKLFFILLSVLLSTNSYAFSSYIFYGGSNTPSASATNYQYIPGVQWTWNATEANVQSLVSSAGVLRNLKVIVTSAPAVGKSLAFTLMLNGVASALTCTISDANTSCTDTTNQVTVAAGNSISIRSVPTGTPTVAPTTMTMEFQSAVNGVSNISGGSGASNLATGATSRMSAQGPTDFSLTTTEALADQIMPTAGTISNLYVSLTGSPNNGGGTQSYAITVRKNTTSQTVTCTISEAATTCNDTSNSFTVVAGDKIAIQIVPSGTPTARGIRTGLRLTTTNDKYVVLSTSYSGLTTATGASAYSHLSGSLLSWNTTESTKQTPIGYSNFETMYVELSAAPGAVAKSYAFITRKDTTTDGTLTCTVTDPATTCNASVSGGDNWVNGDVIRTKATPTGTPTAVYTKISYAAQNFQRSRPRTRLFSE